MAVGIPIAAVALIDLVLSVRIVKQYEHGAFFRLGRVVGLRRASLTFIIPVVDTGDHTLMTAHPPVLQLRDLQSLVEIGGRPITLRPSPAGRRSRARTEQSGKAVSRRPTGG